MKAINTNELKVLVVEDDIRVAELLQRSLQTQNYLVDIAYDGDMGKKLALQNSYSLVITDVILPKLGGVELCKELKNVMPDLPIIMLTALGTTDDKVEGFDAGADDYLVKPFELRELYVRIRAVLKRLKASSSSAVLQYADLHMDLNLKQFSRNNQVIHLTPKEFSLMQYLIQNAERVLSRAEISKNVWDTNFDTGTNFIDVYINYLRKKIDTDSNNKLIHTRSGMGFILKQNED